MPREMNCFDRQFANSKGLVVVEEFVEDPKPFILGEPVALTEELLHLLDTFADANGWLEPLSIGELFLQI